MFNRFRTKSPDPITVKTHIEDLLKSTNDSKDRYKCTGWVTSAGSAAKILQSFFADNGVHFTSTEGDQRDGCVYFTFHSSKNELIEALNAIGEEKLAMRP